MLIENDLFNISGRLKEIDRTYEIRLNTESGKFLLYGGEKKEYLLTFPFDRLDERCVLHARKTRKERLDKLLEEIDAENALIEKRAKDDALRATRNELEMAADKVYYERNR